MKNFKKIVFFSTLLILICFSFLSLIGIRTKWAATTYNHFKGINTINWGGDIDKENKITLSYKDSLKDGEKEDIERVLAKRLSLSGIGESTFYFNEENKTITVYFPNSYNKYYLNCEDIAPYLAAKGEVEVFKTDKDPLDIFAALNKQDNSKDVLLMKGDSITSASLRYTKSDRRMGEIKRKESEAGILLNLESDKKEEILDIYTNAAQKRKELYEVKKEIQAKRKEIEKIEKTEEIKKKIETTKKEIEETKEEEDKKQKNEKLKNLEEELKNSEETSKKEKEELTKLEEKEKGLIKDIQSQNIKITIDKKPIYENNILSLVDEYQKICAVNPSLPSTKIVMAINLINTENLPLNLNVVSAENYSPSFGLSTKTNLIIFSLVLFLALILFLTLKFKILGVLGFLTTTAQISLMVAGYTGFLSFLPGFCVNIYSAFGMILSMLVGFSSFYYIAKGISSRLKSKINLELCIKQTYKNETKQVVKLNILIAVISFVLMGIFSPTPEIVSTLFYALKVLLEPTPQNSMFCFAYSLFFGSIGTLLFQILSTKFILQSAIDFKFFRNTNLYGGIKNETKNQ